jgi:hypothetical protein
LVTVPLERSEAFSSSVLRLSLRIAAVLALMVFLEEGSSGVLRSNQHSPYRYKNVRYLSAASIQVLADWECRLPPKYTILRALSYTKDKSIINRNNTT